MKPLFVAAATLSVCGALLAQGPSTRTTKGELTAGDRTLRTGEFYDEHAFEGQAGQRVTFDLTSAAFDPYLLVIAPSGDKKENDDWQKSHSRSRIELTLTESGPYRVLVTSYNKDERGAYELRIEAQRGAAPATTGERIETGRLAAGDRTLTTGEYYDEFTLQGRRGQRLTAELHSSDFDPYLMVVAPGGKIEWNDDHEGDARRSLVSFELPQDGTYRVQITSYKPGETGAYELHLQQPAAAGPAPAATGPRVEHGRLASGDSTMQSGEFVDSYTFEGGTGQRLTLDVVSTDFDTYLILLPPRGERRENDDVDGKPNHSVIETDITEPGTYRVLVTSYEKGETGNYVLNIQLATVPAPVAGDNRSRDVAAIAYGDNRDGQLGEGDTRLADGEYRDLYAFEGQAGDRVVVELASKEFDPYLTLMPPQGEQIDNDDADGRQDLSRIEVTLPATGRYRIMTTSYVTGETGRYRLTLRRSAAGAATPSVPPAATGVGGRIYGVFVGISQYGGRASDLSYTADDARRIQQALVRGAGMRETDGAVLVDVAATLPNIKSAVENVARQAGPNDTFVFFYSGHGSRARRTVAQPTDPDGFDETLSFYDADLTDDDMSQWLAGIRARISLIVLDSCFSGGFSKDIISVPGRMGLFSSEEDVTSGVAGKFRAGGYLAQFIGEAVGERRADESKDGEITAVELSQYLHERYRADVKSGGNDDNFVRTGGPQTGYQHLVVDRGSIGPYDVVFRR